MKFTRFDPINDRERCRILISHQEDIECSLPIKTVLEVFSLEEWIQKLKAIKKELHCNVLTGKLVDEIMARWQLSEDYPKRQPGEAESREEIEARMKT
ncbi:hypothetical protein VF21_00433 [Pseudogymnoascus sp. 05NY08]|nr:hypothetical protein VF21_00433 [Pseudogymnoascus sp. 05NY08]